MARKTRKPGSQAVAESTTPEQVIEGVSQEVDDVSADNAEGGKVTESASVEEVADPEVVEAEGGQSPEEVVQESKPFEPIELTNGVTINADTLLQCGKCGARFYAKDVATEDGSCPATGQVGGAQVTCGGVLGPIQV